MKNIYSAILNEPVNLKYISIIPVFIFIVSWFSCNLNIEIKTAEQKEHEIVLENKIKTIKVFKTDYRNGVAQKEFLVQVRTYNAEGLRKEELNYNDTIRVHSVIRYEYDKNGNLTSSISKGPDSSLIFREIRKYNNQNKRTELIFYLPDGTYKYRNISIYDNDGNLRQLSYYWPDGLKSINKYVYKQGLQIENSEYDRLGRFNYKWLFSYDKYGNQTNAIQYYPDSVVNAKIISEFNDANQLITQTTFFGNSFKSKFVFEYDNKNLLLTKTVYSSIKIISSKFRYQYSFN